MKLNTQLFLSILLTISTCNLVYAQEDSLNTKTRDYRVWVKTDNQKKNTVGYVSDVLNESIVIVQKEGKNEVDVENINLLLFRRENNMKKLALTGALIGAAGGFVIGAASYDVFMGAGPILAGLISAGVFTIPGVLIGTLVGSFRVKIKINGNQSTFDEKRNEILKYRRVL